MSFLEKKSENTYILSLYVKPNSYRQKIEQDGKFLAVSLKSKAKKNKANKELMRLLKKRLNISSSQITFLAGMRNQDKKLELNFIKNVDKERIKQRLLNH
jgi:hypothetical protein